MRNLTKELENRKIQIDKLLIYGFVKNNGSFFYKKEILDSNFMLIVNVDDNLNMSSKLIELATNDEYLLADVPTAAGEFVGSVKKEYERILKDIVNECTILDVYKSNYTKEVIKYVKEKYNDDLEFLWSNVDNNAIWRNKKNNKWYGALLIIAENKIGLDSDNIIEVIDLRYQKELIGLIVDNKKVFPGYHMNKNNWITIKLDGSVEIDKLYALIDNSYNLSLTKK